MKIALISPRGKFFGKNIKFANFIDSSQEMQIYLKYSWTGFSGALPLIAGLTPRGYSIQIIDENFDTIDFNEKFDLVGITSMTQQATRAYQIGDIFREKGIKVIMGGIHPTVVPDEAKQHADSVVIGEVEYLWKQIIEDFRKNKLKNFYKAQVPVRLCEIPLPRYDLLKKNKYNKIWIQTSRGCPVDCEFCVASKIYGYKYRHKTIDQVIREISLVKKIWGDSKIGFADDNMFKDKKYCADLMEEIKCLHIRWDAQSDILVARDRKILKLIKEAGCSVVFVGFETLLDENLRSMDKNDFKFRQKKHYSEYIKIIQSYGIGIFGAFIIGFDHDDADVFKNIQDFIIENNLIGAQVTILTPFPGSRLRDRMKEEGRILHNNWDFYTGWDVVFKPNKMTSTELQKGLLSIYKNIYNDHHRVEKAKYFKNIYKIMRKVKNVL